jgi:hypothetical protein
MRQLVIAAKAAVAQGNWYEALAIALTMPVIRGRVETRQRVRRRVSSSGMTGSCSSAIRLVSARPAGTALSSAAWIVAHCGARSCTRANLESMTSVPGKRCDTSISLRRAKDFSFT